MTAGAGMEGPFRAEEPLKTIGAFSNLLPALPRSFKFRNHMPDRNFPPPWSVEEHSAHFVVRDRNGQAVAYVYYENASGRRAAKLLTKDEARRIAANIAKLPELLQKP